ncbi:unnamed protein product [Calypogeia fissa]
MAFIVLRLRNKTKYNNPALTAKALLASSPQSTIIYTAGRIVLESHPQKRIMPETPLPRPEGLAVKIVTVRNPLTGNEAVHIAVDSDVNLSPPECGRKGSRAGRKELFGGGGDGGSGWCGGKWVG